MHEDLMRLPRGQSHVEQPAAVGGSVNAWRGFGGSGRRAMLKLKYMVFDNIQCPFASCATVP